MRFFPKIAPSGNVAVFAFYPVFTGLFRLKELRADPRCAPSVETEVLAHAVKVVALGP
jgi:hypothetical protein